MLALGIASLTIAGAIDFPGETKAVLLAQTRNHMEKHVDQKFRVVFTNTEQMNLDQNLSWV